MNRTMVEISVSGNAYFLITRSKGFRSPHRFIILKEELRRLEQQEWLIANDISSFAELKLGKPIDAPEILQIDFSWLNNNGDGRLTGRQETVYLPYDYFREPAEGGLSDGTEKKILSINTRTKPRIEFHSRMNLHQVVQNPMIRRKLGRFLNRELNWVDYQRFVVTDDSAPYSFVFSGYTPYGLGICGGIILHKQGENLSKAYYSLHT